MFGVATMLVVLAFDLLPAMITGVVLSVVYMVYRVSFPGRALLGVDPRSRERASSRKTSRSSRVTWPSNSRRWIPSTWHCSC